VQDGIRRVSAVRVALAGAAVLGVALLLVAVDAGLGGSSHVTAAVGGGPSSLADDLGRRLDVTWAGATASWHAGLLCAAGLALLVAVALRASGHRVTTAFLVALAVSLAVNDSPVDELAWGAIGGVVLFAWESASSGRRSWSIVPQASPGPSLPSA
jgi:hypothetical protein